MGAACGAGAGSATAGSKTHETETIPNQASPGEAGEGLKTEISSKTSIHSLGSSVGSSMRSSDSFSGSHGCDSFRAKLHQKHRTILDEETSTIVDDQSGSGDHAESKQNPISRMVSKGGIELDPDNKQHAVAAKVCGFVCGIQAPPGPYLDTYMEQTLAGQMKGYQEQMASEVRCGGVQGGEVVIKAPEMATLWVMDEFSPSSENVDLRVMDLQVLIVDREGTSAAIAEMMIYVDGVLSSGFTLDYVYMISDKFVSQEYRDAAQARYESRIQNYNTEKQRMMGRKQSTNSDLMDEAAKLLESGKDLVDAAYSSTNA